MATQVDPPNGVKNQGKHYVPIKPISRGAYGVVCSSVNKETNERVAIKKIHNGFENKIDALYELHRGLKYIHSANFLHRDLKPALICFRSQKMLVLDPPKRISVTEGLQHPYFAPLYDPSSNPSAQVPIDLDVDEDQDLGAFFFKSVLKA
ncbi:mitogen-activated protein kinase 2 [Brassica rapa]|uniref:mitogen-activated protein kinase 2 n=1 Tax=Brassica campestris TaxID=3711 RepID=UPI00142DBFEC|nr:mitogen-activated protein kinase 2 [Brassica rapa]